MSQPSQPSTRPQGKVAIMTNTQKDDTMATQLSLFENLIKNVVQAQKTTFSLEEAAAYLQISVKSVLYYSKRIRELAFVPLGKNLVFLKADLDAFLAMKRVPGVV